MRELSPLIPERTEVLVLISAVHDAAERAINYARSLRAPETRAVFLALDQSRFAFPKKARKNVSRQPFASRFARSRSARM